MGVETICCTTSVRSDDGWSRILIEVTTCYFDSSFKAVLPFKVLRIWGDTAHENNDGSSTMSGWGGAGGGGEGGVYWASDYLCVHRNLKYMSVDFLIHSKAGLSPPRSPPTLHPLPPPSIFPLHTEPDWFSSALVTNEKKKRRRMKQLQEAILGQFNPVF